MNTLVVRDGRVLGLNTDAAIVAGHRRRERACLLGAGGAAQALLRGAARRGARRSRARGDWPPDAAGADLVVNATPVRDELLVEPRPGQTVVDLAYRRTTADRARRGRARGRVRIVVDGLEVLVAPGRGVVRALDGRAGARRA